MLPLDLACLFGVRLDPLFALCLELVPIGFIVPAFLGLGFLWIVLSPFGPYEFGPVTVRIVAALLALAQFFWMSCPIGPALRVDSVSVLDSPVFSPSENLFAVPLVTELIEFPQPFSVRRAVDFAVLPSLIPVRGPAYSVFFANLLAVTQAVVSRSSARAWLADVAEAVSACGILVPMLGRAGVLRAAVVALERSGHGLSGQLFTYRMSSI